MYKSRNDIYILASLIIFSFLFSFPSIWSRSIWYDEAITLLETAGHTFPSWPAKPEPARIAKNQFVGKPSLSKITDDLKQGDIHPPIYYWILSLWRRLFGFSLEAARLLSLFCFSGSVIILYFLLKNTKIKRPFIPAFIYSISYGPVHFGGEARAYALANLLLLTGAFFAYLAIDATKKSATKSNFFSIAMAVFLGFAFLTNYLTLFPVVAVFVWFLSFRIMENRSLTVIIHPILTILICLPWLATFINHLGLRPNQAAGYIGEYNEIYKIVKFNLINIISYKPNNFNSIFDSIISYSLYNIIICGLVLFLFCSTIFFIVENRRNIDKKVLSLFLVLSAAPSLGLLSMDILFNKNLSTARYLLFGTFPTVVLLSFGISQLKSKIPYTVALLILLPLQLLGNNWISERSHLQGGSNVRSFVEKVNNSLNKSKIVVIGAGHGRGSPASVIYELSKNEEIIAIEEGSDIKKLCIDFKNNYSEVWIAFSWDKGTQAVEDNLLKCLINSKNWKLIEEKERIYARLNKIL